jgi:hypothetical protein
MSLEINDVVVLAQDMPDKGLRAGTKGVVVFVFEEPLVAYEVEFTDASGRTICTVALRADQLRS